MADLQIRSVDEALAQAAKAKAAADHLTLSDYVKHLIQRDLDAASRLATMRSLLAEIGEDAPTHVSRLDTAAALTEARRDMGTE